MATLAETAREFWDRISPRERKLVVIAAVATPLIVAVWLGLSIHDGLAAMEARNAKMRKALVVVADVRARGQTQEPVDDVIDKMGTEPLGLDTYLDNAAKKAKFTLKSTNPHAAQTRNGFVTNSVSCQIDDLTIDQVKSFLSEIEGQQKIVAVTHLELRRNFRNKDKVDITNIEVSTWSKEPPPKSEGSGSADAKTDKKGG